MSPLQQIADITLFISTFFHVLFAMCLIFANGYHMGELREQLSIEVHVLVVSVVVNCSILNLY